MVSDLRFKYSVSTIAIIFALSVSATEPSQQERALIEHAASCAAYFFSAARAKEMTEYESLYGAGEYAFNLAVAAGTEADALQYFNRASTHINQVMQKRWADFYKVDEHYAPKCEKLRHASEQQASDAR